MNRYLLNVFGAFLAAFGLLGGALVYWQVVAAPDLLARSDNPRPYELRSRQPRGRILDREGRVIVDSAAVGERFERRHQYPPLVHVTGYDNPQYGTSGIESARDAELIGTAGESSLARWWRETSGLHPPTRDVTLTVDLELSRVADEALGSLSGAVVLLEADTGRVLVLAGHPFFDPAALDQHWDDLREDPNRPFLNRATQGLYAPGSVFTLVTLAAALEHGTAEPNQTFADLPPEIRVGATVITSPHGIQSGAVDLPAAFRVSHPIVFAQLGIGLGWDRFLGTVQAFGLDQAVPLELEAAADPLPPPSSMAEADLASTAVGQGRLSVTPLHMAAVLATILNEGARPTLHLVEPFDRSGAQAQPIISPEAATQARDIFLSSAPLASAVAGHSGVTRLGPGVEPHTWFLGAAPRAEPRLALCVLIENGGPDESLAAAIGRRVLLAALKR